MIKNIIFDFGDVFINLDKQATTKALGQFGVLEFTDEMYTIYFDYEMGLITTSEFVTAFHDLYPYISKAHFINAWNAVLLDFPERRMKFIKELAASKKYRLFLLSNTNDLHIQWIQDNWGMELYTEFKNCFEQFYLSYEIHLRKPNPDIYKFVLNENNLLVKETLFIDDTIENTDAAQALGMCVWNLNPETEDIVTLIKKNPF
ncbi:MAG: HAD-IA family hydrolase [Flavobacteriaceae bacterium]|nr:MAG: HAD-IA family hydrolase [Flavobacteriaceae bacterium]